MEFEQTIPVMAKMTTVVGSAAVDMWESQYYYATVAVLMPAIAKC
jgi:hypothetical protein